MKKLTFKQFLIESLISTNISDKKYNGKFRQSLDALNYRANGSKDSTDKSHVIGAGSFSVVRPDKTNAHGVVKNSSNAIKSKEGFNIFASYIANTDAMDNIHMPKVYEINKITDKYGKHIDTYKIEKLYPLTQLTGKEVVYMLESCFYTDDEEFKKNAEAFGGRILNPKYFNDNFRFLEVLIMSLHGGDTYLKPQLAEAVEIVYDCVIQARKYIRTCKLDFHTRNFMFRRTPYGPQLVFSDPIYVATT